MITRFDEEVPYHVTISCETWMVWSPSGLGQAAAVWRGAL